MIETSDTLKILGQNIRRLRLARNLSQEMFAYEANIDRSYIGQVERGERNVAFINVVKMARALGVSVSELTEGVR